jgi:hypothetical protein
MSSEKCANCGHDEKYHHDGEGVWAKGCNQPIAMELGCPCKAYVTPAPAVDEARRDLSLAERNAIYTATGGGEAYCQAVDDAERNTPPVPPVVERGAIAFHKAFDEITAECLEKEFRPPSSTDFGFGWRKAKEYYESLNATETPNPDSVRELVEAVRHYADETNWEYDHWRGYGDCLYAADHKAGFTVAQAALAKFEAASSEEVG